jgi:acetyl-CoA acetyltransferase
LHAHETDITGRIPVNTGGGLVGFGHPVGATGVKQVVELWRQMKGKCGAYQMQMIPQSGVSTNMGGDSNVYLRQINMLTPKISYLNCKRFV